VFQPVFVQDELETTCNDGSSVAYQDTISSSSVGRVRSAASEADDRFECLYVLSITVGLRMGEALGLKWSDIDLDARTLRVSRQLQRMRGGGLVFSEPKNASRRTVDLPQRALEALRRHRKEQMEEQLRAGSNWQDYRLVFASCKGTPLDAQNIVNRHFKPLLKRAGLPDIRWHDLRHTYATLLPHPLRGVRLYRVFSLDKPNLESRRADSNR
jgi:integrase